MAKPPETPIELLNAWDRRALKAVDAHYESARYYSKRNNRFGAPTVLFGGIIATLTFATVGKGTPFWLQISIGILAMTQTVLVGLHTWLKDSEAAENHRQTGARYAALRRHCEQLRALNATLESDDLSPIREELDALAREAPPIPPKIWKNTQTAFKGHGTAAGKVLNPDVNSNS